MFQGLGFGFEREFGQGPNSQAWQTINIPNAQNAHACHVFPQIAIAIGVLTSNRGGGRRTTLADWTWHQGAMAGCHCSVLWWGETMVGQLWGSGRGTRVPLQGAIAGSMVGGDDGGPTLGEWTWHQGAIAGCHCRVYGGGRRWWANFGGVDVAPGCHCWVPLQGLWWGETMVGQLWGSGRGTRVPLQGAIAGCHCRVGQLWGSGRGTRVPLLGAIAGCHCNVLWWGETMVGQLWGSGRGTRVPLQGAIAGCHCRVYDGGRRWWANFGGVDVAPGCHCRVPLLGAIAGCHCNVLWWGETMVGQLWGSGRGTRVPLQGASAGCHCRVPL